MAEWFQSWFDSPYYHLLYKDRDHQEAEGFVKRLFDKIGAEHPMKVLDLACGKGRHSVVISELGHFVTGVDISKNSIQEASHSTAPSLEFFEHDMRQVFRKNFYDLVVNLFTSFGYFDDARENERVLNNVRINLKSGGRFVLDYLNPNYVRQKLVKKTEKVMDQVVFHISKKIEDKVVYKDIFFQANGMDHHFQERVRLFDQADFKEMFDKCHFRILNTWGDYDLSEFSFFSPRQIFLLEKMDVNGVG